MYQFHIQNGFLRPTLENTRREPKRKSALLGIMFAGFTMVDIIIAKLAPYGAKSPFIVLGLICGALAAKHLFGSR